jgi:uncharacterized protein HemX
MSTTSKMDTSAVFEMFETINKKLDKPPEKSAEPVPIDFAPVYAMTKRFEQVVEEVRKPVRVENHHRHTIDITSSKVFLSLVVMVLVILGLSYAIGEQRRIISQYRGNDLKYRYIKMIGKTNEENLYRMEQQFKNNDSIKIIRKQVEKFEELVKEQAERTQRMRHETEKIDKLNKLSNSLKNNE